MRKRTILFFGVLSLAACAPTVPAVTGLPPPTVTINAAATHSPGPKPAQAPTAVPTAILPTATTRPLSPTKSPGFSDQSLGVSFTYPADWEMLARTPDDPPGATLHGPPLGEGPEPIIFAITVYVQPVAEKSVTEIVDQQLAQVPADLSGGIKRQALQVGGEPGEEVIGLPSQEGALETFVLHGGRLYLIILQPYDQSNESLSPYLAQVRSEYSNLLSSWQFLN